jgi:hypothetical protein
MGVWSQNLFALLTLIVAPAVLTNASSVLALNTANRFGRVVDRSRQLTEQIQSLKENAELREIRLRQIARLLKRGAFLLRAQTCFYGALGMFVAAALISVLGAALAAGYPFGYRAAALGSFVVGSAAASCVVYGCSLLVRETRLALESLDEEAKLFELQTLPPAAA